MECNHLHDGGAWATGKSPPSRPPQCVGGEQALWVSSPKLRDGAGRPGRPSGLMFSGRVETRRKPCRVGSGYQWSPLQDPARAVFSPCTGETIWGWGKTHSKGLERIILRADPERFLFLAGQRGKTAQNTWKEVASKEGQNHPDVTDQSIKVGLERIKLFPSNVTGSPPKLKDVYATPSTRLFIQHLTRCSSQRLAPSQGLQRNKKREDMAHKQRQNQ